MGWLRMSLLERGQAPLVVRGNGYQDRSLVMVLERSKGQSDMTAPGRMLDDLQ